MNTGVIRSEIYLGGGVLPGGTFRFKKIDGSFWNGETFRFADYTCAIVTYIFMQRMNGKYSHNWTKPQIPHKLRPNPTSTPQVKDKLHTSNLYILELIKVIGNIGVGEVLFLHFLVNYKIKNIR